MRGFRWPWDVLLNNRAESVLLSRAFEPVVALRIWQLEHGGQYPPSLEALVPGILPSLPLDPYNGQPFQYRPSQGQRLLPLGLSGLTPREAAGGTSMLQPTRPGQWLLYSVGPNRIDDGAKLDYETFPASSDLIFPLPDTGEDPKDAGQVTPGSRPAR
jgi:hypothetical protein